MKWEDWWDKNEELVRNTIEDDVNAQLQPRVRYSWKEDEIKALFVKAFEEVNYIEGRGISLESEDRLLTMKFGTNTGIVFVKLTAEQLKALIDSLQTKLEEMPSKFDLWWNKNFEHIVDAIDDSVETDCGEYKSLGNLEDLKELLKNELEPKDGTI